MNWEFNIGDSFDSHNYDAHNDSFEFLSLEEESQKLCFPEELAFLPFPEDLEFVPFDNTTLELPENPVIEVVPIPECLSEVHLPGMVLRVQQSLRQYKGFI